jgi:hypothetical protein
MTTAESLFERQCARAVLDRVLKQLREEYDSTDQHALFNAIAGQLAGAADEGPLKVLAERLCMNPEAPNFVTSPAKEISCSAAK